MGRFAHLMEGKGETVYIGDEEFHIKPLDCTYLGYFMSGSDKETEKDAANKMILASLRQTDPEITEEDIKELPFTKASELMEVIHRVNELN